MITGVAPVYNFTSAIPALGLSQIKMAKSGKIKVNKKGFQRSTRKSAYWNPFAVQNGVFTHTNLYRNCALIRGSNVDPQGLNVQGVTLYVLHKITTRRDLWLLIALASVWITQTPAMRTFGEINQAMARG